MELERRSLDRLTRFHPETRLLSLTLAIAAAVARHED